MHDALGGDSTAARHRVERDPLAEEEAPRRAPHGRDLILGSSLVGETAAPSARCHSTLCGVRGRSVDAATLEEEEDGGADARAAELGKDLVDEGDASEHSLCASWTSASAQESAGAKRGRTSLLPHKVASS